MRWVRRLARRAVPTKALHAYRMARHVRLAPFERELAVVPKLVAKTEIAFDVGANVGLYTAVLARSSRRVVAIEPNRDCARYLRRLRLRNVNVIEAAAAEAEGTATLHVSETHHGCGTLLPVPPAGAAVPCNLSYTVATTSLDAVAAAQLKPGEKIGLVKIDVEGSELGVLRGAAEVLARHRPNLIVETEYRHGADVSAVFGLLQQLGYAGFVINRTGEFEPVDADRLARLQAFAIGRTPPRGYVNNVVFLPEEEHAA